jgi:hypothetical protein
VVIGFWDYAVGDEDLAGYYADTTTEWRDQVRLYLRQARATGEVPAGRPDDVVIDTLLAMLMGLQINALFMPRDTTPQRQRAMLDAFLESLTRG